LILARGLRSIDPPLVRPRALHPTLLAPPASYRELRRTLPTLAFADPSSKFRRALADSSSSTPSLEYLVRLAERLPSDGHVRYRNTDPQTRQTSLHLAALRGRADVASWLLAEGVDETEVSRDVLGETVLHVAAAHGHVKILDMYLDRYPFVRDWANSRGMTPLHTAAMKGELEAAQLLVDAGSDINAPDLEGNSPLHFASSWGRVPIIKLLIDRDCDPDLRNHEGFSAAEYAYSFGVLKELEASIRQHLEEVKAARRASRRSKSRSNSQTLRAKRTGSQSALSIALPPMPSQAEDHDGEQSASSSIATSAAPGFGLGLSHFSPPDGVPQLGSPIPPTPQAMSPLFPRKNGFREPPLPNPDTPSEPQTPISPYPNTTSPQPSPVPSLASTAARGSRPSTPKLSPLMFRRFSRAASNSSRLSTPTSAAPCSPNGSGIIAPSPVPESAHSTASPATHTAASPASAQTATPTPASPTPAPGSSRRLGEFAPAVPVWGDASVPLSAHLAHARVFSDDGSFATSTGTLESGESTYPPVHAAASPPPPPLPPPQQPAPAHNKLVRKSRSHAHSPSLSLAAGRGADSLLPMLPSAGAGSGVGAGGQRSASGPPHGGSGGGGGGGGAHAAARLDAASSSGGGASGRSSFDVADAFVEDSGARHDRERARGHKLRKGAGAGAGAGSGSGSGGAGEKHHHAGRLARALGFRK
ncbi:hypothetical protein JCM3770_000897, partial [Rhodotorula araucariae]